MSAKTLIRSRAGRTVIVTDYGGGGECRVQLDHKVLNLPPTLRAIDLKTGEPVTIDRESTVKFRLQKHDFKAILVQ